MPNGSPSLTQGQPDISFLQKLLMGGQAGLPQAIGWGARHPIQAMEPVWQPPVEFLQRMGGAMEGIRGAAIDPALEKFFEGFLDTPSIDPRRVSGRGAPPATPQATPQAAQPITPQAMTPPVGTLTGDDPALGIDRLTILEPKEGEPEDKTQKAYLGMARIEAAVEKHGGNPMQKRAARSQFAEDLLKGGVDPLVVSQWVVEGSAGMLPLFKVMISGQREPRAPKAPPGVSTTLSAMLRKPKDFGFVFVTDPRKGKGLQYTEFRGPIPGGYFAVKTSDVGFGKKERPATQEPVITPYAPQMGLSPTTPMPSPMAIEQELGLDEKELKAFEDAMRGAPKWGVK